MLNLRTRLSVRRALAPTGAFLHRLGVRPNAVTVFGTLGTVVAATLLIGTGRFVAAALTITVFVLFDLLDGAVARAGGTASRFGAVLDSTFDRVADASIFAALIWWLATSGASPDSPDLIIASLLALTLGQLIPYVRARAESLGVDASLGLADRAVRLTVVLVGLFLDGLGLPFALAIALWLLVVAGAITVAQRLNAVRRGMSVLPSATKGAPGQAGG